MDPDDVVDAVSQHCRQDVLVVALIGVERVHWSSAEDRKLVEELD
jgi:hypothetical protein